MILTQFVVVIYRGIQYGMCFLVVSVVQFSLYFQEKLA